MAWNFPIPEDVQRALVRLRSLKDGDLGVIEIVACGSRAVPVLRALLFEREPSGLYQTRCRAVQALAALRANETLIDFLSAPSDIADPVERIGEDAVINAAALAVAAGLGEERVFQLLMSLADNRLLPGVVGALGMFERVEALPFLVEALAEDESRPTAETALRRLGAKARQSLLVVATRRPPSQDQRANRACDNAEARSSYCWISASDRKHGQCYATCHESKMRKSQCWLAKSVSRAGRHRRNARLFAACSIYCRAQISCLARRSNGAWLSISMMREN